MEKLTVKKYGELLIKYNDREYRSPCFGCNSINKCNQGETPLRCGIYKALEKLKEYEDSEEQGKLLRLPCVVGDTVYTVCSWGIETGVVGSMEIISDRIFVNNLSGQMIGEAENVFLSREEAEAVLKRIKN